MKITDIKISGITEEEKSNEYTLYVIRCYNKTEEFIKVGFTRNKKVNNRFGHDFPYNFNILKTLTIRNTETIENMFHAMFFHKRYFPEQTFSGYTECYPIHCLDHILFFMDGLFENTFLTNGVVPKLSSSVLKNTPIKNRLKNNLFIQRFPANNEQSTRPGAFVLFNNSKRVKIGSDSVNCYNVIRELKKKIDFTHYAVINGDTSTKKLRNELEQDLRTNYNSLTIENTPNYKIECSSQKKLNKGTKHYVVTKGRKKGIFDSWEKCKKSIYGFKGAKYKSYPSYEEAADSLVSQLLKNNNSQESKSLLKIKPKPEEGYVIDVSCTGRSSEMRYKCTDISTGEVIIEKNGFLKSNTNIVYFLAILDVIKHSNSEKKYPDIYSGNQTPIKWIRKKRVKTPLKPNKRNADIFRGLMEAEKWLKTNKVKNRIFTWNEKEWGNKAFELTKTT